MNWLIHIGGQSLQLYRVKLNRVPIRRCLKMFLWQESRLVVVDDNSVHFQSWILRALRSAVGLNTQKEIVSSVKDVPDGRVAVKFLGKFSFNIKHLLLPRMNSACVLIDRISFLTQHHAAAFFEPFANLQQLNSELFDASFPLRIIDADLNIETFSDFNAVEVDV
jgi:hypothetical protein